MFSLNFIPKDLEIASNNITNSKAKNKDSGKDFFQVLEGQKNDFKDEEITNNRVEKPVQNLNKPKEEINHKIQEGEPIREYEQEDSEETNNELLTVLYSLYNWLDKLKIGSGELDGPNLEIVELEIEQLSNLLVKLTEDNSLVHQDQNLLEIVDKMEEIALLLETQLAKHTLVNEEKDIELPIKEDLTQLNKAINNIKSIAANKPKASVENAIELEGEDADTDSKHTESTQLELEEPIEKETDVSGEEETIPIVDKRDVEVKDAENTNPTFEVKNKSIIKDMPNMKFEKAPDIDNKEIIQQIVDKVKLVVDDYKQEIKISLKPEILGELMLNMEVEKGNLLARIMVDNYRTKELIEANLYQLKEDMKENGLEIKTFEVFVGTNEDFQREKRQEFHLGKKSKKIKVRDEEIKEIKLYDENVFQISEDVYGEGQLNLFA